MIRGRGQKPAAVRRRAVLKFMAERGGPVRRQEIEQATGLSHGYVSDLLAWMAVQGYVRREQTGWVLTESGRRRICEP